MRRIPHLVALGVALLWLWSAPAAGAQSLSLGILPVLDTLPLQVAVQEGLFAQQGLDVVLVPFSSALERDTAMRSGQLDGYFGDLLNTLMLIRAGVDMRIVTVSYATTPGQRMFGLVLGPGQAQESLGDDARVGISKGTVIEYLLDSMERQYPEVDKAGLKRVEVKQIPIRLQMLLAGQLEAALLPEPLVSLAESKGATVVATDEELDMPLTVVCLHQEHAGLAGAFRRAYAGAVELINREPEAYRELMAETCRIPAPLVAGYPMVEYPAPALPTQEEIKTVQQWMTDRGLLEGPLDYGDVVAQ